MWSTQTSRGDVAEVVCKMKKIVLTEDNYITVLAMLTQKYEKKNTFINCKHEGISTQKKIKVNSIVTIEPKCEYKDLFIQTILIKNPIFYIEIKMGDSIWFLPFGVTIIHKQNNNEKIKLSKKFFNKK